MMAVPYKLPVTLGSTPYLNLMCRVTWRIHLVEAVERVVEEDEEEGTIEDELVRALEGMNTT